MTKSKTMDRVRIWDPRVIDTKSQLGPRHAVGWQRLLLLLLLLECMVSCMLVVGVGQGQRQLQVRHVRALLLQIVDDDVEGGSVVGILVPAQAEQVGHRGRQAERQRRTTVLHQHVLLRQLQAAEADALVQHRRSAAAQVRIVAIRIDVVIIVIVVAIVA